jgi:hypothetical protein
VDGGLIWFDVSLLAGLSLAFPGPREAGQNFHPFVQLGDLFLRLIAQWLVDARHRFYIALPWAEIVAVQPTFDFPF